MSQFSKYKEFRSNLGELNYVTEIYVEMRDINNKTEIVGFFGVDDFAESSHEIIERKNQIWPTLQNKHQVLETLNSKLTPSFMVFSDKNMTIFCVHESPFNINTCKILNKIEYAKFIEGLGAVKLSGRKAANPKYPDTLSSYSVWHYSLDWSCKCRDIDYIEIRQNESIRTFLEVTGNLQDEKHIRNSINLNGSKCIFNRWQLHQKMFIELSHRFNSKAYFIIHTADLSLFCIYNLQFEFIGRKNNSEYKEWLKFL